MNPRSRTVILVEMTGRPVSLGEEVANAVTHGVGLLASLVGVPVLLGAAVAGRDTALIVGAAVFGATLVGLYAASTLYHALPPSRAKRVFRVIDHAAIYLLIAGSYTPFTLGVLRGAWGWLLLGLVWALAVLGILFKTLGGLRFPRLSTLLYLGMGWLAVIALRPLALALPGAGLGLLVVGGLLYTGGVLFFVWERPRYSHMVWHLFVLGGSACHFLAVLWYALPRPG
jgi:hemolysin III